MTYLPEHTAMTKKRSLALLLGMTNFEDNVPTFFYRNMVCYDKIQSNTVFQRMTQNDGLVANFSLSKLLYLVDLFGNRLGFSDYRGNQNLKAIPSRYIIHPFEYRPISYFIYIYTNVSMKNARVSSTDQIRYVYQLSLWKTIQVTVEAVGKQKKTDANKIKRL
jgi:hypothetical protein